MLAFVTQLRETRESVVQALPLTETVLGRQKSVTVAGVSLNPAIFAISRFFLGQKTGHYSYSVSL